jgi:alpha-tubulin suppressor-like RCC1 family protein
MSILETLRSEVEARIAALTSTDAAEDMLVLTASLDSLTEDRMNTLELVDDLPEAPTVPEGTIFYVNEINTLVFSLYDRWLGIDGRVLRLDPITAFAWGYGYRGRLGDNTVIDRSSPVTVVGGITNWKQVSAGSYHSLGITDVGIAYSWGPNNSGVLGDGTIAPRSSPVTVVGGITNWSQVSTGNLHSLGVTNAGIIYSWGRNFNGQLGDGTAISRSSPVTVIGGIANWSQVSAGGSHSLGLTDTGIAYAWGNNFGALGDGTNIQRSSPVTVVGGITNWSQVIAGNATSLGIVNGIAYAWGSNYGGRLGDETTIVRSSPVTVVGGITNWSQVSAGGYHSLGITRDGIAYAWGFNGFAGRLGDNTVIDRSSPVTVVGGITNWKQVSASAFHSLGLTDTGIAYGWGDNFDGTLGDDTTVSRSSPVMVVGGITTWTQVSAGRSHSLALKTD